MMQLIMICLLLSLSACNNDAETKPKAKKTAVKIDNEVHEVLNYNKPTTIESPSKV